MNKPLKVLIKEKMMKIPQKKEEKWPNTMINFKENETEPIFTKRKEMTNSSIFPKRKRLVMTKYDEKGTIHEELTT